MPAVSAEELAALTQRKYISMKMLPNGSRPPMMLMTAGLRYHFFWGMGEGIRFTLHHVTGLHKQMEPALCKHKLSIMSKHTAD